MSRVKPPTLSQLLTVVNILNAVGNINWKAHYKMFQTIKDRLPDYWGRILLIAFAAVTVAFVVFDWRRAHVEKLEARSEVIAITAERNTLIRERDAELIARAKRAEALASLTKDQVAALAEVKEILEQNEEYASQPLPEELRRRLAQ